MIITRKGNKSDIEGVLSLQKQNLFGKMPEEELKNGFVTTPFTTDLIEEIIAKEDGLFVAENESNEIIAYVFAASWRYFSQWEIFNYMVSRLDQLSFNHKNITTENSFQYGPICIAKSYRGRGIINLIFEEMRVEFVKRYPISITFINKVNIVSEKAHTQKLGWQKIDEFQFNNNTYLGLALDMNKSVL